MDALAITTGILSLVGAALQGAQTTKAFIDGIRGAPRAVNALSSDLASLTNVLETLKNYMNHIDQRKNPELATITAVLQAPLDSCVEALNNVKREIEPFVSRLSGSNSSKWKAFMWTFREKDIIVLQQALLNCQSSLNGAVAVVTLKLDRQLTRGFGNDNESIGNASFTGSSAQNSDYGYALRRFMLETELASEDSPPRSITSSFDDFQAFISRIESTEDDVMPQTPTRRFTRRNAVVSLEGFESYVTRKSRPLSENLGNYSGWRQKRESSNPLPGTTHSPNNQPPAWDLAQSTALQTYRPKFGVSLDEIYRRDGTPIPMVVRRCVQAVEILGLEREGIYRVPGKFSDISTLKTMIDTDVSELNNRAAEYFTDDINCAAGLLKLFLRELPDPLLTNPRYESFIKAAHIDDDLDRQNSLKSMIKGFSRAHYATLRFIVKHLHRVQEHATTNLMTTHNLATCFGPTLMGVENDLVLADTRWQIRVTSTLIQKASEIFDLDDIDIDDDSAWFDPWTVES